VGWDRTAAQRIDSLLRATRLNDLDLLMQSGLDERMNAISATLRILDPAAYLIGCGPYNCGLFRLSRERTVVGRESWATESSGAGRVDIVLRDGITLGPREVSRRHLMIEARPCGAESVHFLADLGSTCGTYLNGIRVPPGESGQPLADLDVVSLGPSQVNVFAFAIIPCA